MKNYIIVAIIIILIVIAVLWYNKAKGPSVPVDTATTTEEVPATDTSAVPAPADQASTTDAGATTTAQ